MKKEVVVYLYREISSVKQHDKGLYTVINIRNRAICSTTLSVCVCVGEKSI